MRKLIPRVVVASIMLTATLFMNIPQTVVAQEIEDEWKYGSVSYIEAGIVSGYNPCAWVVQECANQSGSSCTKVGVKTRGLLYCLLGQQENWRI